jgi:enoyl-CoA hydratase
VSEFVDVVIAGDDRRRPRLATLLLSRPPTNAVTRQVYREIAEAVADLGARDDVGAVIVFGGHEIFCAGEDMPERSTLNASCAGRRWTRWPGWASRRSPRSPAMRSAPG